MVSLDDYPKTASSFSTISNSSYHLNVGPSFMRGAVFWEPNKPLTFEDFEMPRPKVNEVLIKTKGRLSYVFTLSYFFFFFSIINKS